MRILHRYILKELLKALALALPAITGVFCFAVVLQALQSQGLGPAASILFMVLSVPMAVHMALTLAAVLVATLVYGRLAVDNEIMACRASGIPVMSLLWPALLVALLASGLTLALAAWPLPESQYAAKKVLLADAENLFFSKLSNGRITFRDAGFQMTVDRVIGDRLYGMTILHRSGTQTTYAYAPVGKVQFDNERHRVELTLWDAVGDIVRASTPPRPAATDSAAATGTAPAGKRPAATGTAPAAKGKTAAAKAKTSPAKTAPADTSTSAALVERPTSTPVRGDHVISFDLPNTVMRPTDDLNLWQLMAVQHNPRLSEEVAQLADTVKPEDVLAVVNRVRATATGELHGRLATALGCLGLVLLGAALGAYFHSGNLLTAFGIALVPWLAAWALTSTAVKAVGDHVADPQQFVWIVWAPNVLVLILGLAAVAGVCWVWGYPVRLRHRLLGTSKGAPVAAPRSAP